MHKILLVAALLAIASCGPSPSDEPNASLAVSSSHAQTENGAPDAAPDTELTRSKIEAMLDTLESEIADE